MIGQIVSKKRVADHGEVFTSQREVNAMLDMVKHETERIDSRFLEPACGTGNFLAEILTRKLGRIPVLKARMNADLHMAEDLKNTGKGKSEQPRWNTIFNSY